MISAAAALTGIHLTPEQDAAFEVYLRELTAWNAHTNLTAISDPHEVRVRHFLDSLTVASVVTLAAGMRLIDVGAGAGFPGLPLALAVPGLRVMLLEATGKKVVFLQHVIQTLGLTDVAALHARAEDAGHMPEHRAAYDVVTARAVARLPILLEYLLPLAKVGGRCVALKGKTARAEAADAGAALKTLKGRIEAIHSVQLPGVDEPHYLIVVEKTGITPALYPRKPGIPTKKPIS